MNTIDPVRLYGQLKARGFTLATHGDGLIYVRPKHKLRNTDRIRILQCKPDLLALVRATELGVVNPHEMKRHYRGHA